MSSGEEQAAIGVENALADVECTAEGVDIPVDLQGVHGSTLPPLDVASATALVDPVNPAPCASVLDELAPSTTEEPMVAVPCEPIPAEVGESISVAPLELTGSISHGVKASIPLPVSSVCLTSLFPRIA